MKNLMLVFVLFVVSIADASAMTHEKSDNNRKGIPAIVYRVNVQPPVEVLQIQSKSIIEIDGVISKFINIDCEEYNGIPMKAPIKINYNMTKKELGQSLCKSFGVDSVDYFEGVMPEDYFARRFSFFLEN